MKTHSLRSHRNSTSLRLLFSLLTAIVMLVMVTSAGAGVTLTATKTDALIVDVDGDGQADPGDTLEYTVVITNDTTGVVNNLVFTDTLDANTTLVSGSLHASPVAVNDTYPQTVIGNVSIDSSLVPYSVTSNDFLGLGPTATIGAFDATSVNGGQVTMITSGADMGQFTYNPPPGFEGTDTFTYTLNSSNGSNTATVSISVSGMVWFINNAASPCTSLAAGCGRLSNPFSTLAAFNTLNDGSGNNPAANDNIFVYESATQYTGAVTLLSGQKLIGQDATASLETIAGRTLPSSSPAFPAMNSGNGTRTDLGSTVTLNTNVTVRGLEINSTTSTGMNDPAGAITGVSVSDISVSSTTATAVALSDIGGTFTFTSVSSNGGTSNGLSITNQTGSFSVNGDGSDTSLGGNSTGGTIKEKSGSDGSTSSGIGIYLNNVNNITLRRMTINGTNQNYGIRGLNVNNLTLEYATVSGTNGDAASLAFPENVGEGSIYFGNQSTTGLTGSATINKVSVSGGRARNFSVVNTSGTLNRLTITGSNFGKNQEFNNGTAFADDSLSIEAHNGGTVLNATVTGSTFSGAPGDLAEFVGQSGTTMDVVFQNNTLSNNHVDNVLSGGGMTLATQGAMTFHVTGNTLRDANGSAITLLKASGGSMFTGFVDNNTIGVSGVTDSGSKAGNGIYVSAGGTGTMSYTITNNTIRQIHGNAHIYADNTGGSYTANFTIDHNTLEQPGAGWFAGIAITNGAPSSGDTINVCAKIGGPTAAEQNTLNFGGGLGVIVGSSGATGHTFNLPGYAGGANLTNVQTFIQGNNTGSFTTDAYADAPATAAAFTGAGTGCGTPTAMLLPNNTRQLARANVDTSSDRARRENLNPNSAFNLAFDFSKWLKQTAFVNKDYPLDSSPISTRLALPNLSTLFELAAHPFALRTAYAAPAEMPKSAPADVSVTAGALPANKSVTIKFRATISASLPSNVTQVSNQGTVTFDGGSELTDDPATPASNDATVTLIPKPDLAVTKSDAPNPVNAGENITYTINLNNNGTAAAQTVTLTDAVPTNTTFVSAQATSGSGWTTTSPAGGGTGNVVFSKTTMAAAESAAFQIVVKAGGSTANGTTITNSATAGTTSVDSNSSNDTATAATIVQTRADLALTKSDSPDPVNAGSNITYTLSFVNNGPSDAQTVSITDTVPSNTTFVSAQVTSGSGWTTSAPAMGATGDVVFAQASVDNAETATFAVVVKVNDNAPNAAAITNSATAASATTDPVGGNNIGSATTIAYNSDLIVTKTNDVSGSIPQGGPWNWKLTVQNTGGVAPSFGVGQTILVDTLPAGNIGYSAPVVSNFNGTGTINCAIAGSILTCTAGTAVSIPADTGMFDVGFTATPSAAGTFTNPTGGTCQVDPNGNVTESDETNNACNSNSVMVVAPPVIGKTFGASNIALNGTTALTITLTNPAANSVALTGVAMTDTLPSGLQVAGTPNASNTCSITFAPASSATTLNATGITLNPSSSCTLKVDVTGTTSGPKTNTTNAVTSTNGGTGNTASATLQVAMPPQISKSFAAATKAVNETTALTFVITNTDSVVSLTGVGFTDNLPSGLQVASTPNPSKTCGGTFTTLPASSAITLTNVSLSPSASCSLSVDVVGTTIGVKDNTTSNVTSNEGGNGNTASASITITPAPTMVTITGHTPSPSIFNQSVTFTATVTSAQGTPTGTVTLNEGATLLGTGTLNAGVVTFNLSSLSVGTHTITATYQANGSFASSTSPSITHIVNLAPTTTTISGHAPSPSIYHQTVTFTVAVTSTQGTPSGNVELKEGAVELGEATSSSGVAEFLISSLSAGTHTLTAEYDTDGTFASSTSPSVAHTVNKATTAATVSSSSPTTVFGQNVTFTATLTSSQGTPTGTATFFDGATSLGDGALDGSGIATLATNSLSVSGSPHTVTARYNGDTNFSTSTSESVAQNVNPAATTTALGASTTTPTYGQSVYFTATLSVTSPGSGTPTGSVTFYDGATALYTGTLAGNVSTFMTNTLAVNGGVAHNFTARYNGTANFSASPASPGVALTVGPATLNVTADDKTKMYGAVLPSLTASYAGFVLGQDEGVLSGTPLLTTTGLSSSSVGSYPITVALGGLTAANYTFHLVNGTLTITTAQLTVNANNKAKFYGGANPTLTASITGFVNGDTELTALTGASSLATTALANSPVGTYPITVTQGTLANIDPLVPNYAFSFVDGTLTVNKDNTGATLSTSTPNPSTYGQTVTFTATVTSSQGITPNGTVTFKDGATTLGTGTLNAGGVATFATSVLTVSGSPHSITATYGGSSNFNASAASSAVARTVSKATTAMTLTVAPPNPSLTGQAVTANFTVTVNLPGGGTPTGTVTVTDGTVSCSASVAAGSCLIIFNSAGAKTLTATYGGDSNYAGSTSNSVTHTVTLGSCTLVGSQSRPSLQQQQPYRLFLPFVQSSQGTPMPDLIVQSIRPINNTLQIVLLNQGNGAVTDEFWVDLYINPNPLPTRVNQIWQNLGSQGAVWGVTAGALPRLAANGTLTLTTGDGYYWPSLSNSSSTLPAGTCIYAQVDSASTITTYGAVLETHEANGGTYNNISGMQLSGPVTLTNRASPQRGAAPSNRLPSR